MNFDVFLSHNSKDKPEVEQIGRMLEKTYGVKCWLDTTCLRVACAN